MSDKVSRTRKSLTEIAKVLSEGKLDKVSRKRIQRVHNLLLEDIENSLSWSLIFRMLQSPIGLIAGIITIVSALLAIFYFVKNL